MQAWKITTAQRKTVALMIDVHSGGTWEMLGCGDIQLTVPALIDNHGYDSEVLFISRRGRVWMSQYLNGNQVIDSESY